MLFSVIIPVYKVEKYLKPCIDSVLGQTFTDYEIILVDDGSPDLCPEICDEYAKKDKRVKVIHQHNQGQSGARNTGLEHAIGDYVCFIDSDDYLISSSVLQTLADKTESNPDIVNYKFKEWFESDGHIAECRFDYDVPTENRSISDIYCDLIDKDAYYNSAWSKIIKRTLLVDNGIRFEKGLLGEDNEWFYHVVMSAEKVDLVDKPLYVYRRRRGSITTTTTRKNLTDQLYVIEKWVDILKSYENDPRKVVVLGSLAKQYCSAVIIYSGLSDVPDLYPKLKEKSYLLNYTKTGRVVTFRKVSRLFGLKGLINLLKIVKKNKIIWV